MSDCAKDMERFAEEFAKLCKRLKLYPSGFAVVAVLATIKTDRDYEATAKVPSPYDLGGMKKAMRRRDE